MNTPPELAAKTEQDSSALSLRSRAVRAGVWLVGIRIVQQLIALTRPLVLARILAPEDFGVIGIAFMTRIVLERIGIGGGIQDALIRKDDLTKEQIAAAWTFELSRIIIFGAMLAAVAPWISDFFNAPAATPILRVTGLEIVLSGFTSMGMLFVRKELEFKKEFYYRLIPIVLSTAVTIWLAFELRNVWALALGQLTQTVAMLVLSYIIAPYFIKPSFAFGQLRDIAGFAMWTSLSNLASTITSQADRFFVGRILGPTSLGFYVVAGRVTNLVSIELMNGVTRVGFPAFAKAQKHENAFNRAFEQLVSTSIYVLGPLALFIAIWAPEIVEVVLGPKWFESAKVVRILAGASIMMALVQIYLMVLRSKGDAASGAVADLLRLAAMLTLFYPLITNYGLLGAGYTLVSGLGVAFIYLLWKSRGVLNVGLVQLAKYIALAGLLSTGLLLAPVLRSTDALNLVETMILGTLSFSGIYIVGSVVMSRLFELGPLQLVFEIRKRRTPAPAAK